MQSIPYDPGLTLGNVVDDATLQRVLDLSQAQEPAATAQEQLDSLMLARRSLAMTIQELAGMDIDPTKVIKAQAELDKTVKDAGAAYAKAVVESQRATVAIKTRSRTTPGVHAS